MCLFGWQFLLKIDLQTQKMKAESQIECIEISTEKTNAPVDEMAFEHWGISNTKPHEMDFQIDITEQVR